MTDTITIPRALLEQLLEALESCGGLTKDDAILRVKAITALRSALEQPQQAVEWCTYPSCQTTAGCAGVCKPKPAQPQQEAK